MEESHYRKLEKMYASAPINNIYHPEMMVGKGKSEITITICPEFFHAAHAVHGSVYFKMLDDAAFFAVNSLVQDVFVLTVSFNIYLIRPVTEGKLISRGRVVNESKRLYIAESELFDSNGKIIARGSGTFMKSGISLSAEVGYI
ncbi:MAG: PaaI family thioesterase [Calditrichaceae bacterium]